MSKGGRGGGGGGGGGWVVGPASFLVPGVFSGTVSNWGGGGAGLYGRQAFKLLPVYVVSLHRKQFLSVISYPP